MSEPTTRLPRRDFLLIPLLSLLTCMALFAIAEAAARVGWPESGPDVCVMTDARLGHRFKPNCDSLVKTMESPWVANHYNECGYRTDQGCGPRPEGVRRVDLMGSSTPQGYMIPYDDSIGAVMERSLTRQCGAQVQVENMAMIEYQGEVIYNQLDEALALKPDAVVYLVTPFDFDETQQAKPHGASHAAGPAQGSAQGPAQGPPQGELLRRLHALVSNSRAVTLAQHFIFADPQRFASLYMNYGDRADFIRPPFTAAWKRRLANLDDLLGRMQARLASAGVKLVLAYVPSHVQAVYLADPQHRPPGVDPAAFGRAIGAIAAAHDVGYVDLSGRFAQVPDAGTMFYPQDGHLTAQGQPIVGRAIAEQVVASAPPFRACARSQSAALHVRSVP